MKLIFLKLNAVGRCDSLYDAIALSFKADRHDRVAGLFEVAHERPNWRANFDWFVDGFFARYLPEKNSTPLKRFLTFRDEEFGKKHPVIFKTICQEFVGKLKLQPDNLTSQKLLVDLVGQPSLLTPVAFAGGFLCLADNTDRANFIKYGYKEVIEEGLKEGYYGGGGNLWTMMVRKYSTQFSGISKNG